jgi:GTP cyclohydrolase IA
VGNARVLRQLPARLKKGPLPDVRAMERAVADFLSAAGLDVTQADLAETPARVASAWATGFLDGYARTPKEALADTYPAPKGSRGELVVVTGLRFHSMCPHHLLPVEGRATLAYVPGRRVVGFGRLGALLDTLAHRLVLQETLAREVAAALAKELGSPATACVLEAHQACLRVRGEEQSEAVTHAEAYTGALRRDGALRRELWVRIAAGRGATR